MISTAVSSVGSTEVSSADNAEMNTAVYKTAVFEDFDFTTYITKRFTNGRHVICEWRYLVERFVVTSQN